MREQSKSERQALLVLSSYSKVAADERLVERFYGELEVKDRKYHDLIPKSRTERKQTFDQLIKIIIKSVYDLERMRPDLKAWVERGMHSGLKDHDFALIAQSLVWSLEDRLGADFTEDVKNSWLNHCQRIIIVLDEILHPSNLVSQ